VEGRKSRGNQKDVANGDLCTAWKIESIQRSSETGRGGAQPLLSPSLQGGKGEGMAVPDIASQLTRGGIKNIYEGPSKKINSVISTTLKGRRAGGAETERRKQPHRFSERAVIADGPKKQ